MIIVIPVAQITDWESFHKVFQQTLGFPNFYGHNMDAWIDCMTYIDAPGDALSDITVSPGEILVLRINHAQDFKTRCPEQYEALIECSAFVNFRRVEVGEAPVIALLLSGHYKKP